MRSITKKQALACAEALISSWPKEHAPQQNEVAKMLVKFTGEPIVLAAIAVRVSDSTGEFPDLYQALIETAGDRWAKCYAIAVYQFDQMRKRRGEPSLPVRFDGHGALNVIYLADWKMGRAVA